MAEHRLTKEGVPLCRSPHELKPGKLTPRQRQIAGMFCSGWDYRSIAAELDLSEQTINPTLRGASKRLGLNGRIARAVLTEALKRTRQFDHHPLKRSVA